MDIAMSEAATDWGCGWDGKPWNAADFGNVRLGGL